jgi:pyruvate kinase
MRYRPEMPCFVLAITEKMSHRFLMTWGVQPIFVKERQPLGAWIDEGIAYLREHRQLKKGDRVLLFSGDPQEEGVPPLSEVLTIE